MTVATNPIEFDPFSEEFFNEAYELYGRLRDAAPCPGGFAERQRLEGATLTIGSRWSRRVPLRPS